MSGSLTQLYLSNPALATAIRRRQGAETMQQQGMSTAPTDAWGALARIAQAYVGQRNIGKADEEIKGIDDQQNQESADFKARLAAGSQRAGTMPAPVPVPSGGVSVPPAASNASFVDPASGAGNYTDRVFAAEGTGKNPLSSASGHGQFIDGTWMAFAKANPNLFPNMTPQQILAARDDPAIARQATDWLGNQNAPVLKAAGVEPTEGAKGLAHYLGAQPAAAVWSADPNTPVETALASVLPPERVAAYLKANPSLVGKTTGQVSARYRSWDGAPTQVASASPQAPGSVPAGAPAPAPTPAPSSVAAQTAGLVVPAGATPPPGVAPPMAGGAPPQRMAPAAPDGGGGDSGGGPAPGPPRASPLAEVYLQRSIDLQQQAMDAATSRNPKINAMAPYLQKQADFYKGQAAEKPGFLKVGPGDAIYDPSTGRTVFQQPASPDRNPLVPVQGPDGKWRYATRSDAAGQTAPAPAGEPLVSVIDPATGKPVMLPREKAVGMQPAPAPMVSIDQRGPNAETTARGTGLAKEGDTVREAASAAAENLDSIRYMRNLNTDADRFAEARRTVGSLLDGLGIKGADTVKAATNLQAFNAAASSALLSAQLAQKGPQTEFDARRIADTMARADNTTEANKIILRAAESIAERQIEKGQFYSTWRQAHGNSNEGAQEAWTKFIRETPNTMSTPPRPPTPDNPKGAPGGVEFFNEFKRDALASGLSEEEIIAQWRSVANAKPAPKAKP